MTVGIANLGRACSCMYITGWSTCWVHTYMYCTTSIVSLLFARACTNVDLLLHACGFVELAKTYGRVVVVQ